MTSVLGRSGNHWPWDPVMIDPSDMVSFLQRSAACTIMKLLRSPALLSSTALQSTRNRNDEEESMKKSDATRDQSASELISKKIAELADWRGEALGRVRELIREADPDVVEEWKWMGTPVWSHHGIICTGESYKSVVKLTFAKGASLNDPDRLFNSSLDGNARRAIDIHEGEEVDPSAFKALVREAVALNSSAKSKPSKKAKS